MSVQIQTSIDAVLPTDITIRVPVVARRSPGIVAELVARVAAGLATWQENRAAERLASDVPSWLREDIGLPPEPHRHKQWWELHE